MKIAIFGSGLVGSYLESEWKKEGHELSIFQRKEKEAPFFWDPKNRILNPKELEGYDLLVNTAGESIMGRWNQKKKEEILNSRVESTSLIAETISHLQKPPKLFVNFSAIGFYGDRGNESLDESSSKGALFLSEVADQWERAAEPALARTRVVFPRLGVVLSTKGGALKQMLTPFKLGLGGKVGSGKQWVSWITLEDIKGGIDHLYQHPFLSGPLNFVSPEPVRSEVLTTTLAKVLNRPHLFPLPAFAAKLAFGEMASELLLSSEKVFPKKLQESFYSFKSPFLEPALKDLLKQNG